MQRSISQIAVALLLALTCVQPSGAQSGTASTGTGKYTFHGHLGFRTWDGVFAPIVPDVVLVGWGDGRCQFTLQSPREVPVAADGTFHVAVEEIGASVARVIDRAPSGSADTPYCVEAFSWPCYRFRASGCDDRVVEFGRTPPEAEVEMNCPGRRGPRPKRDG